MKSFMILVALLISMPAFAQNQDNSYGGGSRLPPKRAQIVQSGESSARLVLFNFAQCIYARKSSGVERLMQLPIDTPEYEALYKVLFDGVGDSCIEGDGSLKFTDGLLRGALFEAAYIKKFGSKRFNDLTLEQTASTGVTYSQPMSPVAQTQALLQSFARCVVLLDTPSVRSLILASPGGSRENILTSALAPKLGQCLITGQKVEFSKPSLRGILAEALYRMTDTKASLAK